MNRNRAIGVAVVLFVLGGCGAQEATSPSEAPSSAPTGTGSPGGASEERRRCRQEIPFEPTYLPAGFERDVRQGPAPGGRPPDDETQVILHFRGSNNRSIEIRRPGTLFTELAQSDDAPTIRVLGTDTAGFAPIEPHGNEFMVQFQFPAGARPHEWCSLFSLNEYGVSLAELTKVAEGLRETE